MGSSLAEQPVINRNQLLTKCNRLKPSAVERHFAEAIGEAKRIEARVAKVGTGFAASRATTKNEAAQARAPARASTKAQKVTRKGKDDAS
jgi:hypothetical protein